MRPRLLLSEVSSDPSPPVVPVVVVYCEEESSPSSDDADSMSSEMIDRSPRTAACRATPRGEPPLGAGACTGNPPPFPAPAPAPGWAAARRMRPTALLLPPALSEQQRKARVSARARATRAGRQRTGKVARGVSRGGSIRLGPLQRRCLLLRLRRRLLLRLRRRLLPRVAVCRPSRRVRAGPVVARAATPRLEGVPLAWSVERGRRHEAGRGAGRGRRGGAGRRGSLRERRGVDLHCGLGGWQRGDAR
eukprot:COSAG04_NODE_10083_length_805_cov_1.405099_1_plen_247_part_10